MVINPIVGVYIPIIRIPIKGGMTIPNIATFDYGTCKNSTPPKFNSSHLKIGLNPIGKACIPTIHFGVPAVSFRGCSLSEVNVRMH